MEESKKEILRKAGFGTEVEAVESKMCPFCGKKIDPEKEFKDELSRREFGISGLCQGCQDGVFG
jgi:hypothetical protein